MSHTFPIRVFYEDTDMAGIVYYANYLRYIERARTEWVRALGIDQVLMKAERGIVFAVRRVEADYLRPARFDDQLIVRTSPAKTSAAQVTLRQDVWRGEEQIFAALVTLVALKTNGRPTRLPAQLQTL